MNTRSILVALAAMTAAPALLQAQAGPQAAQPISLAEAVKLAQQYSPTTVTARNAERNSEQGVRTAKAQFLPSLTLGAQGSQRGGTQIVGGVPLPISGLPWSYNRTISGNMVLFDGGKNWYGYRSAEANLTRDDAGEVAARFSVALNVKIQYFAVLAARESESAARRQLDQAQQQLKVSSAKMAAGAATRADSLTAAIQVANARLQILTAQNNLLNANAFLTRLIASPVQVTAVEADTAEMAHLDIDETALDQMVIEGPAVKQSVASLAAAHASHRSATTPYLPTLTLTGSYGQVPVASQNFNFGSGTSTISNQLSFQLSYTLFDRLNREAALVSARISEDNAEVALRDARLGAKQSITSFVSNYRTAQEQIQLQLLTIQAAEEAIRVVQQRYNLGTAQLLDVLSAQTTLDNARAGLISARLSARTAKANIEALIGHDLP
jgi:outer membrane protein